MGKTTLPEDTLTAQDLSPVFVGQSGLPREADALAYDPVQRLLAVRKCACTGSSEAIPADGRSCVIYTAADEAGSGFSRDQPACILHYTLSAWSARAALSRTSSPHLWLQIRSLQVGSTDGRVLLFGRDGVEQTLPSPTSVATAGLFFLPAKDSLLRITTVRTGLMTKGPAIQLRLVPPQEDCLLCILGVLLRCPAAKARENDCIQDVISVHRLKTVQYSC